MQVVENALEIWKLEKYMHRWTMNLKTRQLPCEVGQSRCTWEILVESGTIDELGKFPGLHEQSEFHNASLRKCGDVTVRIEVGPTPALRNLGEVGANFLEEMGQWMVWKMYDEWTQKSTNDLISKGNWTMDEPKEVR
jgi:hypothetical protein